MHHKCVSKRFDEVTHFQMINVHVQVALHTLVEGNVVQQTSRSVLVLDDNVVADRVCASAYVYRVRSKAQTRRDVFISLKTRGGFDTFAVHLHSFALSRSTRVLMDSRRTRRLRQLQCA